MTLRYGRALMVSRIAGQPLANPLMPREPAHVLSEWRRSGRAALNAAGGQVRTSVKKVTLSAKLATAFGKRPVTAKKPTEPHATAMANDPAPRIVVAPESKERQCHPFVCSRDDSAWLASHVDLEHLPSFEVDVQRAWPSRPQRTCRGSPATDSTSSRN